MTLQYNPSPGPLFYGWGGYKSPWHDPTTPIAICMAVSFLLIFGLAFLSWLWNWLWGR